MNILNAHIPITEVTVFEDRAHVVRRGLVQFPEGPSRIELQAVSPVLIDKTLKVTVLGPVQVDKARVGRNRTQPTDTRAEEQAHRLRLKRQRLETEIHGIDRAMALTLEEITEDAAAGRGDQASWKNVWSRLGESARQARRNLIKAQQAIERLDDETPTSFEHATLTLDLRSEDAGPHPIQIDYVVPNATWRPCHRAELFEDDANGASVVFSLNAQIWQQTGEDWTDAFLFVSTQHTTAVSRPPELRSDVLETKRVSRPPVVVVDNWGPTIDEIEVEAALLPNDAGRVQRFPAIRHVCVPSDGRAYLLSIASFTAKTHPELVVRPETSSTVWLRSSVTNKGEYPILAGPIDLIRQGGLVGRGSLGFIEPKAPFNLVWGREENVHVQRVEHQEKSSKKKNRESDSAECSVEMCLSNLGVEPCTVRIESPTMGPSSVVAIDAFGHKSFHSRQSVSRPN